MIRSEVNHEPPRLLTQETKPEELEIKGLDSALIRAATKARLGGHAVFVVGLPTAEGEAAYIAFRSLKMDEFDAYASAATMGDVSEILIETAVIYPVVEDWSKHVLNDVLPGAFEEFATQIVECSGFESKNAIKGAYGLGRQQSSNVFSAAHMFIMKAMPGLTPDALKQKDIVDLFKHVAMAEHMMSTEEQPVQFPLREILTGRREQKTSRLPDFEQLPVYHPHEVAALRSRTMREYTMEKTRQMRMAQTNPQEVQKRRQQAVMRKRRQIANQRAAESEGDDLRKQFGGLGG